MRRSIENPLLIGIGQSTAANQGNQQIAKGPDNANSQASTTAGGIEIEIGGNSVVATTGRGLFWVRLR